MAINVLDKAESSFFSHNQDSESRNCIFESFFVPKKQIILFLLIDIIPKRRYNAFEEYHVKHNLSAMEKLFAGYVNARLDSYLMIIE